MLTETFENGKTLKLSGLNGSYKPEFSETDNWVDVSLYAVNEGGTITVEENTAGYAIRLQCQKFTFVGNSGDDTVYFDNLDPQVTVKYTVGSGGNDYISGLGDSKIEFVTVDYKPVACSIKHNDYNSTVSIVGQNTITLGSRYDNIESQIVNGVSLMAIDGLNVNVDEAGNSYYEISSAADLVTLANYSNTSGKVFKLTADISDRSGVNFTGIGAFSGIFDVNVYTISNLSINLPENTDIGLFGYVGSGGTIQNLTLDNVNITGKIRVGSIVGQNLGTVTNCTVTNATVSGNRSVGELVGYISQGTLTGNNYHGNAGDVGFNDKGTVSNTQLYCVAVSGATFTVDEQTFALGSDLQLAKVTYLNTDGTTSEVVRVLTGKENSLSAGT